MITTDAMKCAAPVMVGKYARLLLDGKATNRGLALRLMRESGYKLVCARIYEAGPKLVNAFYFLPPDGEDP